MEGGEDTKININPFNTSNPMSLKDAFIVSLIGAIVIWILQFFANAQWEIIIVDIGKWSFDAAKNFLVTWAGLFGTFAGLEQLIKKAKEES